MKCPKCTSEMIDGQVHIGGGIATALAGGLSMANLTFTGNHWRAHVMQETSDILMSNSCSAFWFLAK